MKNVPNSVMEDFRRINHLTDILQDTITDKHGRAIIRQIKKIVEVYK